MSLVPSNIARIHCRHLRIRRSCSKCKRYETPRGSVGARPNEAGCRIDYYRFRALMKSRVRRAVSKANRSPLDGLRINPIAIDLMTLAVTSPRRSPACGERSDSKPDHRRADSFRTHPRLITTALFGLIASGMSSKVI